MNVYTIALDYAQSIMEEREYWSDDDLYDITAEHADGSEYVIYFYQAHAFVKALPSDVQANAEWQVEDCGGAESYDDYAVKIAYFALQALMLDAVQELLDAEEAA